MTYSQVNMLGASRQRRSHRDLFIDLSCLLIVGYSIFYSMMRPFGISGLIVACSLAAIVCLATRQLLYMKSYAPFFVWATVILALSLAGLMPRSWTRHYDTFAAIRHFAPLAMLPVLCTAFFTFFIRHRIVIEKHALKLLIFLYALRLIDPLFSEYLGKNYGKLHAITNDTVPIWVVFTIWLFRRETPAWAGFLGIATLFLVASSAQSQIMAFLLLLFWTFGCPRLFLYLSAIALFVFLALAPLYPIEMWELDNNTGVRAVMWGDVWQLIADTRGLGVGFGTEYITNQFYAITSPEWGLGNYRDDYFYIATHSTVYDMLLRVGIPGLVLFLGWLLLLIFSSVQLPHGRDQKMFYVAGVMLLIVNSVNVGVYSINFLFGIAMIIGFLEALRRQNRRSIPDLHGAQTHNR